MTRPGPRPRLNETLESLKMFARFALARRVQIKRQAPVTTAVGKLPPLHIDRAARRAAPRASD